SWDVVRPGDCHRLAAVNGDARHRQQPKLPAKRDKPRTHFADRKAVILAEISNRLVIGNQPTCQPHHLNVAASLALKPAARLNPTEVAVDVELKQHRRMIGRAAGCFRIDPAELVLSQIEPLDKDVNHANRIVLANPVFQAFRKRRALPAIRALNEAPHPILPRIISRESHKRGVFTQPGSNSTELAEATRPFMSALPPIPTMKSIGRYL